MHISQDHLRSFLVLVTTILKKSANSLFSYLFTCLTSKLRRLKIYVLKGEKPLFAKNGDCFNQVVALWRDETSDEKRKDISRWSSSLFQKNLKVFELPLFAIFNYKASHCLFNTKIFYSDFFGWANWLFIWSWLLLLHNPFQCYAQLPTYPTESPLAVLPGQHFFWTKAPSGVPF